MDRALEEIGAPKLSVEQAWRIIAERILDRVEAGAITLPDAGSQLGMLTTVVPDAPEELLPLHGLEDYLDLSLLTDAQWDVALTQELAELRARLRGEHAEHGNDRYGLGALYWLRRYGTMPEQRA